MEEIRVGEITVPVIRKAIRSVNIRLYPPHGDVRVTAPERMPFERIEAFVLSKSDWILKRQAQIVDNKPIELKYQSGETHYFLGESYTLHVIEGDFNPKIELCDKSKVIKLYCAVGSSPLIRKAIITAWYSVKLEFILRDFIAKWERVLSVKINSFRIRSVKSKWGSCNVLKHSVMFNLQLIHRPLSSIEYIVVHELTHLLERGHNRRFYSIIEGVLPRYREAEKELRNRCN